MAETIFRIEGLNENKEFQLLEEEIASLHGVERALIDTATGEVHVQFNGETIEQNQIEKIIEEKGFTILS
jgi:hypothetical protein